MQPKRWVLRLAESDPPKYLSNYRTEPTAWTILPDNAEPFTRVIDAMEMARRLEHILRSPVEAVSVPDAQDNGHAAIMLTVAQEVEAARYMARDRLCEVLMSADLDDDDEYDEVELELARAFLLEPSRVRAMRRDRP